jgi:putative phosphoribosyl transferase
MSQIKAAVRGRGSMFLMDVVIPAGRVRLEGALELPAQPGAVVAFAHGSGSGRHSPRNRFVAAELRKAGLGTLLLDLLTPGEDERGEARFDIDLLTGRLGAAVRYLSRDARTRGLAVGLFGASTGAASALRVAASDPTLVKAVVSRGGRPDLAGPDALSRVTAPTLLIVGAEDHVVVELNEQALDQLARCEPREMVLVPHATHLFEEPGTLEEVARLACEWFARYLQAGT